MVDSGDRKRRRTESSHGATEVVREGGREEQPNAAVSLPPRNERARAAPGCRPPVSVPWRPVVAAVWLRQGPGAGGRAFFSAGDCVRWLPAPVTLGQNTTGGRDRPVRPPE